MVDSSADTILPAETSFAAPVIDILSDWIGSTSDNDPDELLRAWVDLVEDGRGQWKYTKKIAH